MNHETGDSYIRRTSTFIRRNEAALAESAPRRRRNATPSTYKAITLEMDIHRLYYLLIRIESLGINVGSMDVKVINPSKPLHHIQIFRSSDASDSISIASSVRTSLSAVSSLTLGSWFSSAPPSLDSELKFIYSSFTKIPALALGPMTKKSIIEMEREAPNENSIPLDSFKNLQSLVLRDIDARGIVGWDRLADSLIRLEIRGSGIEDPVTDVMVHKVVEDQRRRENEIRNGNLKRLSRSETFRGTKVPETVTEDEAEEEEIPREETPLALEELAPSKWAFLRHLCLHDNGMTDLPVDGLKYLRSLTTLDLSSNLFIAIPSGLDTLPSLASLNLSDNMISSIVGIASQLGQILSLNLAKNRLETICGLERVLALSNVDVSENLIIDVDEVGRLAPLPQVRNVNVAGNPFMIPDDADHRIPCFTHFWRANNREVMIDGSLPGFYERRVLESLLDARGLSTPAAQQVETKASSPPVVPVANAVRSPRMKQSRLPGEPTEAGPSVAVSPPSPPSDPTAVKRKPKRVVDFDKQGALNDNASVKSSKSKSHHKAKRRHVPNIRESQPTSSPHEKNASENDVLGPLPSPAVSHSAKRRARVSASMFEPPTATVSEESGDGPDGDAEAFKRKIEALRTDMGDGWLKVFNQTQEAKGAS